MCSEKNLKLFLIIKKRFYSRIVYLLIQNPPAFTLAVFDLTTCMLTSRGNRIYFIILECVTHSEYIIFFKKGCPGLGENPGSFNLFYFLIPSILNQYVAFLMNLTTDTELQLNVKSYILARFDLTTRKLRSPHAQICNCAAIEKNV
jgi:hypothetical protein